MDQDYKAMWKGLYDTFGEDVILLAKAKLADRIHNGVQEHATGQDRSTRDERDLNPEDADTHGAFDGELLNDEEEHRAYDQEQEIYFDADRFEQRTADKMKVSVAAVGTSTDVFKVLVTLVEGAVEVAKFEEAQITVRTDISARRDIALAQIENQKAVLLAYLDKSFDERKENFEKLFSVVTHALETNNMEELGLGLQSIIKLAESSPFQDLASIDATAAALGDPDHEWDF